MYKLLINSTVRKALYLKTSTIQARVLQPKASVIMVKALRHKDSINKVKALHLKASASRIKVKVLPSSSPLTKTSNSSMDPLLVDQTRTISSRLYIRMVQARRSNKIMVIKAFRLRKTSINHKPLSSTSHVVQRRVKEQIHNFLSHLTADHTIRRCHRTMAMDKVTTLEQLRNSNLLLSGLHHQTCQ